MRDKLEIRKSSQKRLKNIGFGEPVTNVCAGENNPLRHCFFVRYKDRSHIAVCTDGKGKFADFTADVVYAGHLPYEESERLYMPVWEATFGKKITELAV